MCVLFGATAMFSLPLDVPMGVFVHAICQEGFLELHDRMILGGCFCSSQNCFTYCLFLYFSLSEKNFIQPGFIFID